MRVNITLECTSCKERNYLTNKNKRNNPDRLEKNKNIAHVKEKLLYTVKLNNLVRQSLESLLCKGLGFLSIDSFHVHL